MQNPFLASIVSPTSERVPRGKCKEKHLNSEGIGWLFLEKLLVLAVVDQCWENLGLKSCPSPNNLLPSAINSTLAKTRALVLSSNCLKKQIKREKGVISA